MILSYSLFSLVLNILEVLSLQPMFHWIDGNPRTFKWLYSTNHVDYNPDWLFVVVAVP